MNDLTVVIPVWGRYVAHLPECLDAVKAQGVGAIVVVDNASSDPLPALPTEIEVIRLPERVSIGAARNVGLARVDTTFVCFADVDDRVTPGTWQRLIETLHAEPELVAAAGQVWWVDEQSGFEQPASSPRRHVYRSLNRKRRLFSLYLTLRMALPTTTVSIFKTDVVRDAGGFADTSYAEDWQLAVSVAVRGPIAQLQFPAGRVLVHRGSLFNRDHSRRELGHAMRQVRNRIRNDDHAPLWLKVAASGAAPLHEAKAALTARRPPFANWNLP